MVTSEIVSRAGRCEWIALAVLALPALLISMDFTVLVLALPKLSADLAPTSLELLWITDIYGFVIAGALITMGTLGDRIGRRRLLLAGAAGFGAASVLAAFSASAGMLIAARAVLGLAGATLLPSTLALARNIFHDPKQRAVAIGVLVASFSGGTALGPLLAGALLEQFWWGSVFLINLPVMALLLAAGPRLLPESRDPDAGRLDVLSAALSLGAVLAVIYAIKRIATDGVEAPALVVGVAGIALGVVFLRRQARLADPLVDLRLFRVPAFSVSIGANGLGAFLLGGMLPFLAQYLQLVLGQSPFEAGLWSVPFALAIIVGGMLASALTRLARPASVVGAGLALTSLGVAALTQLEATSGLAVLVSGSVVMGMGMGLVFTLGTDMIIGAVPPERAGSASALSETGNELGAALGIALLGSIGTAVYRAEVDKSLPAAAPSETTAAIRASIGGAVDAAAARPKGLAGQLLEVARDAFTQGVQLGAAIGAVAAFAMALTTTVLLRGVRADTDPESLPNLASDSSAR